MLSKFICNTIGCTLGIATYNIIKFAVRKLKKRLG